MRSPVVRLSSEDLDEIERLTALRQAISAGPRTIEKSVVQPEHRRGIIRLGVTGEIAVARLIGGRVVMPEDGVIGAPADVETLAGRYVEVKTAQRPGLNFILYGSDPEHFAADFGVLCYQLEPNAIEVVGWMTRAMWLRHHEIRNLRVPTMTYPKELLEPMLLFPDLAL